MSKIVKQTKKVIALTSTLVVLSSAMLINNSEAIRVQGTFLENNYLGQIMAEIEQVKNKDKYSIDTSMMFKDENDVYTELRIAKSKYEKVENYKGKLFENKKNLLKILNDREEILRYFDKAEVYATLRNDINHEDKFSEDLLEIISTYRMEAETKLAFILPEIDDASDETITEYLEDKKYEQFKELIGAFSGNEDYYESEETERILALAKSLSKVSEDVYTTFTNKFNYEYSESYFEGFSGSEKDLKKREQTLYQYYEKEKNGLEILASALEGQVKYDNFYAQLTGYNSAVEMAVLEDGLNMDEYELIFQTNDENLNLLHRWNDMKMKMLSVDEMTLYDTFLPLNSETKNIHFDDGASTVKDALSVLGSDYINEYDKLINGRRIDVFPKNNKYQGGYTWGAYDTDSYILMNYENDLNSMLTLAHEVGHAVNATEINKNQKYDYSYGSIFTGEVTSICNEVLTLEYLVQNAETKEEKKKYLIHYIKLIEDTLFKQLLIAEFENQIHLEESSGTNLNGKYLNDLYSQIVKKYYGDNYKITEYDGYEWTGVRHLYWNSYVYKYATGFATSINVAEKILKEQPGYLRTYQEFLGIGNDMDSISAVKTLGVDYSDKSTMEKAYQKFDVLLDELEVVLEKN